MKIGIDLDEVVAKQLDELVKFYYKKTGKMISKDKFHTYYWPDVWGISLEDAIKVDKEFKESESFDNLEIFENAKEILHELSKKNKLYIITARPVAFKDKTLKWIKKNIGLPIAVHHSSDFHLGNKTNTKANICQDLGVSVLIEDQEKYAEECAAAGINVLLFNQPWNKNCCENKNIVRVNGWNEVLDKIEGFEK